MAFLMREQTPDKKKSTLARPWAVLAVALATAATAAWAVPPSEYEVKAAFIHNIAKFVEWPVVAGGESELKLCILGQNPFGGALETLRDKQIGGMTWKISAVNAQTYLKDCRVLFISASEAGNLKRILDRTRGGAVLTLGDTAGYAEQGVVVNFFLAADSKIRFEINAEAARQAGFKIGSQLLKLARIVPEEGK